MKSKVEEIVSDLKFWQINIFTLCAVFFFWTMFLLKGETNQGFIANMAANIAMVQTVATVLLTWFLVKHDLIRSRAETEERKSRTERDLAEADEARLRKIVLEKEIHDKEVDAIARDMLKEFEFNMGDATPLSKLMNQHAGMDVMKQKGAEKAALELLGRWYGSPSERDKEFRITLGEIDLLGGYYWKGWEERKAEAEKK